MDKKGKLLQVEKIDIKKGNFSCWGGLRFLATPPENPSSQRSRHVQRLENMEEEKPPSINRSSSSTFKRKETRIIKRSTKNVCKPMESIERFNVSISRNSIQILQQGQEYNGIESTKVMLRIPWNTSVAENIRRTDETQRNTLRGFNLYQSWSFGSQSK
jgi:hypothetical protein